MAKKKNTRAGRRKKLAILGAQNVRRETFSGLPIVDAKADFTLLIHTRNVNAAHGHHKDAANCILAKACAEQVGASIVAFFRRTAYLELPDSNGARRVVRFLLDKDAAAVVAAFDQGKSVRGEVTVTLRAPTKGNSLDAIREKSRAARRALISGTVESDKYPAERQRRWATQPRVAAMDVRSGTGMVHNTVIRKAANPAQLAPQVSV